MYILRSLREEVRNKGSEKWETNDGVFLHYNAPAHQSALVKDFLAKKNVTTLELPTHSPDLAAADFSCFLDRNQHWSFGAFVTLDPSLKMRRKSWKGFHKMASRNVSNIFKTRNWAEVYIYKRGLFRRKCGLNDCTVLYFIEIKLFRKYFEATAYYVILFARVSQTWKCVRKFIRK